MKIEEILNNMELEKMDTKHDVFNGRNEGKARRAGNSTAIGQKDLIDGLPISQLEGLTEGQLIGKAKKSLLLKINNKTLTDFAEKTSYGAAWQLKQLYNGIITDCSAKPWLVATYVDTVLEFRKALQEVKNQDDWDDLFENRVLKGEFSRMLRQNVRFYGEETARKKGFLMSKEEMYTYQAKSHWVIRPLSDFDESDDKTVVANNGKCIRTPGSTYFFYGFDPKIKDGWVLLEGSRVKGQGEKLLIETIQEALVQGYVDERMAEERKKTEARREKAKSRKRVKFEAPKKVVREGAPDYRKGRHASTYDYTSKYKIDGTLFGTQFGPKMRDEIIDRDYDCNADLCQALQIAPESVGLGTLVCSFGARGCGKKAGGFYSLDEHSKFIPKKERGSKAHEHWHFFDHMIGESLGYHGLASEMNQDRLKESYPAYAELIRIIRGSGYAAEGSAMDAYEKSSKPYYGKICELLARAGETFVLDELEKLGIKNTSLVYLSKTNAEKEEGIHAYPQGEERELFNGLFRDAIEELIEKGFFKPYPGSETFMLAKPEPPKKVFAASEEISGRSIESYRGTQISFF